MSKENIDYRAIVERIAEMIHGGVTDIGLLTVTVQAMKERNSNLARQCDELANELNAVEAIHNDAVFITDEHYEQCPPEVQKIIGKLAVMVLPATDAFLREVRAQGVEMFADSKYCQEESQSGAHEFAAQLRNEVKV